MTERKRPKGIEKQIKELKAEAHSNVSERGTVQFRLDPENMSRLLKEADRKGTGYGVLARQWTLERLSADESKDLLQDRLSSIESSLKNLESQNKTLLKYMEQMAQAGYLTSPPAPVVKEAPSDRQSKKGK
jgi:hypothetical protein